MKYAVAALMLCLPAFAFAQPYIAAQGGITFLQDADISASGTPTIETTYDAGYNLGFKVGNTFGAFRLEGQFQYASNDLDQFEAYGLGLDAEGDVSSTSLLVNGIYVFLPEQRLRPYVGAGIGVARVSINDAEVLGVTIADDSDSVFAYQFMVGMEYDVGPRTALYAGYHYLATEDPQFQAEGGGSFDAEYASSNLLVGLRYSLD